MSVEVYIPVSSLEHDKNYEQVFLIARIKTNSNMVSPKGEPFARVLCKDVTGEIEGVIWDYNGELTEGCYANIKVSTKLYRGSLEFQAQASDIEPTSEPLNKFDYIKGVNAHILSSYSGEIEDQIMSIEDSTYLNIMGNALHSLDLLDALRQSPYGITGPMAYRGGLLVHVAHSMRLALVAIQQAKELELPFSPSLVIAGCALRNIGWHTTTRFQGDHLRSRDAFNMTGIHRASARYIDHLMLNCESALEITIPESKRQALENMCFKRENILTLEGKIVSCADNMADVLDFSVATLQKKQRGNWNDELFTGHLS